MSMLTEQDLQHFKQNGYIVRTDLVDKSDLARFTEWFDTDRSDHHYRWHPYGYHQSANYDALVTTPAFDDVVRYPPVFEAIQTLMGGSTCFGEIGARHMRPYEGECHRGWHRDRPHWAEHPYRMDYIQLMLYLTDVGPHTHCFSLSPESIDDEILEDKDAQISRGGVVDIHGPAGTVCLFNVAALHTATTRPTSEERKTLQIYYGHRDRAPLANDSVIPPYFWKHHTDPETRAFYGNLNEVTRTYAQAFGIETE
jgi:ectoine hydroxylase-related dioxygenase (phytanoyl-CoA dioxygenase family)